MENRITEQESLSIISEMIDRVRNNVQKGSGSLMIFWGTAAAIVALLNTALIFILENPNQSFWAWTLMIPCGIGGYFITRKIDRESMIKTHLDKVVSSVWVAFAIFTFIFLMIVFGLSYSLKIHYLFYLITPVIMLGAGVGEYITSCTIRYKPFLTGAIVMWLGALLSGFAVLMPISVPVVAVQFAVLAVCMIAGFVIPGYKLNKMAK